MENVNAVIIVLLRFSFIFVILSNIATDPVIILTSCPSRKIKLKAPWYIHSQIKKGFFGNIIITAIIGKPAANRSLTDQTVNLFNSLIFPSANNLANFGETILLTAKSITLTSREILCETASIATSPTFPKIPKISCEYHNINWVRIM